jgi:hypothetical protein
MARKKKDFYEYFYYTVDDWAREYRFGINRHRWEFDPDHDSAHNKIVEVTMRVKTSDTTRGRKIH